MISQCVLLLKRPTYWYLILAVRDQLPIKQELSRLLGMKEYIEGQNSSMLQRERLLRMQVGVGQVGT